MFSEKLWSDPKSKWERKLNITINQDDWENSIKNCILTKYSNNLMDLNLQILRNNIITNDRILKMNKLIPIFVNFVSSLTIPYTAYMSAFSLDISGVLWMRYLQWLAYIHLLMQNNVS